MPAMEFALQQQDVPELPDLQVADLPDEKLIDVQQWAEKPVLPADFELRELLPPLLFVREAPAHRSVQSFFFRRSAGKV